MSACLFMINPSDLTHKKPEEIQEMIDYWKAEIAAADTKNRFESDRASGFRLNIEIALFELECRKMNTTNHSVTYRIHREIQDGAPNLKKALLAANGLGVGYIKCTNTRPDKWFEYVTEEELRKQLK